MRRHEGSLHRDSDRSPFCYKSIPWLGLQKLEIKTDANPNQGKIVFEKYCTFCHGNDGLGTLDYPPLWGDHSFNDEAGLNRQGDLEAFIYHNMPYDDPSLSEQEARDVASYIIQQPRPILRNRAQKS